MIQPVEAVRTASRSIVRELGFMSASLAGTDLTPSAVHALIEVDAVPGLSACDLAETLRLDKSSVSRMLHKLKASGDICESTDPQDARRKTLSLTERGRARVSEIHAFGRAQVSGALSHLTQGETDAVVAGLQHYAKALASRSKDTPGIEIRAGYSTGLIARVTDLHADYYARTVGFGRVFEAGVAGGLAEFCDRLDAPANQIWTATQSRSVVGAIAIDGESLGPDTASLRWFIVSDAARGHGLGRQLMAAAMAHVDGLSVSETHLWTFAGLDAARHLYEAHGFHLAEERRGNRWGDEVLEQRFVRPRPTV